MAQIIVLTTLIYERSKTQNIFLCNTHTHINTYIQTNGVVYICRIFFAKMNFALGTFVEEI